MEIETPENEETDIKEKNIKIKTQNQPNKN